MFDFFDLLVGEVVEVLVFEFFFVCDVGHVCLLQQLRQYFFLVMGSWA